MKTCESLCAPLCALCVGMALPASAQTLYFAGDSTLDEHCGDESTYASWGSGLRPFLREGSVIVNYGRSGRSTTSFIREGWWGKIVDALTPGDFVVIQFGHNDQKLDKPDVATPIPQYKENLRRMAADVRAKGATPVFATPLVRLTYGEDGLLTDAPRLDDWAEAMRETAAELGVDLVDMRAMTRKAANEAGETEALTWYATGDRTHPAVKGARLYASFFLEDVQRRGLPISKLFFEDNLMDRIAIICAHPDDLIGCLGLCHLARGLFDIHVIDFTHGERGCGQEKFESGWTKARRTAEEEAVCASVGATLHWLDEIDGEAYARPETVARMADILREISPRAVIAHWPLDVHTDHVMSAAAALKAVFLAGIHPEIWFMEQTHQSKRFAPDILLDFSAVADKVWASLRLYECQYGGGGLENRRRMLAELNGLRSAEYGGKVLAEGYVRFTPRRQGERSVFDELPFPGGSQGIPLQGARN